MSDHPILFSTDMVKAILSGKKTQTRRIVKPQALISDDGLLNVKAMTDSMWRKVNKELPEHFGAKYFCPHGQPGDLLWVRETFTIYQGFSDSVPLYKTGDHDEYLKWTPSVHMPRWASRLTLKTTDIRIERVQDISEEDAKAEGVKLVGAWIRTQDKLYEDYLDRTGVGLLSAKESFQTLWDSINSKSGHSWAFNPWVWVIEFEVINKNIDKVIKETV